MTARRKISLHSFLISLFMLTAISCSGSTLGKREYSYSQEDLEFIQEYKSTGSRYKVGRSYQINDNWYHPHHQPSYNEVGLASWYGPNVDSFTANGEHFDPELITAAHPTLPLPSIVEVTNLDNGRKITVRVNDRGPFHSNRIIDVSKGAARKLGMLGAGTANVRVELKQEATLEYMQEQVDAEQTPYPISKPEIVEEEKVARMTPIID